MGIIIKIIGLLAVVALFFIFRTQTSSHQVEFLKGHAFDPLPDGFWKGDTTLPKGTWQGKRFDAGGASGMNVFLENDAKVERIPFKLYNARAIWDPTLTVTRIDYNVRENPWYLRPALDEIVEVSPGKLLGKIHYRIFPGSSITIGYFSQEKGE